MTIFDEYNVEKQHLIDIIKKAMENFEINTGASISEVDIKIYEYLKHCVIDKYLLCGIDIKTNIDTQGEIDELG